MNEEQKTTDGSGPEYSICQLFSAFFVMLTVTVLIALVYKIATKACVQQIFEFFGTIFSATSTLLVGLLGIRIVDRKFKSSSSNVHYPFKYGKCLLKSIMKPLLAKYDSPEKYQEVAIKIYSMLEKQGNLQDLPHAKTEYWQYVFYLQNIDSDFNKLWNDYNFYSSPRNKHQKAYYDKLEKCIFIKIFELAQKK